MSDSENEPLEPASASDDLSAATPPDAAADLTPPPIGASAQPDETPDEDRIPVPDDGLGEWPTNGGPLGCLVGLMTGCVLAGFLGSTLISFVHFSKAGAGGWFIFSAVMVMLVFSIVFATLGWRIGKRFYREYAPTARQQRIAEQVRQAQLPPAQATEPQA